MRTLDIRIHDATLSLWQDNTRDPTFRHDVFDGLTKHLGLRGWTIGQDEEVRKRHRCISKDYRTARKGELLARLHVSGRRVELQVWAETWEKVNSNGHRYDFDKRQRMGFLTRLRLELEFLKISEWAATIAATTISDSSKTARGPHRGGLTALQWIERDYASSSHTDKALGRPICTSAGNAKSSDGWSIWHGATVWFADDKGRLCRGVAHYHINNMWWVVTDRWGLKNLSSSSIFYEMPKDLRRRRNDRQRRVRLEAELARAVLAMRFERAIVLRNLLFGQQDAFLIWHKEHSAFYRSNYSGYTTDRIAAGRYTRQEAARKVGRVSHLLTAVDAAGRHLDAATLLAGAA